MPEFRAGSSAVSLVWLSFWPRRKSFSQPIQNDKNLKHGLKELLYHYILCIIVLYIIYYSILCIIIYLQLFRSTGRLVDSVVSYEITKQIRINNANIILFFRSTAQAFNQKQGGKAKE